MTYLVSQEPLPDRAGQGAALPGEMPTGWRKESRGTRASDHCARDAIRCGVGKARAFGAVRRIGVHIGLKANAMLLLDTLASLSPPQDWERGRRPIVWASNTHLAFLTGQSLSTLKRLMRRLAEAGLVAFKDSPNGKRWGFRDSAGHVVEAYGLDLSPLDARTAEFEELHQAIRARRQAELNLRRQVTIARRTISAQLELARHTLTPGEVAAFQTSAAALFSNQLTPRSTSIDLKNSLSKLEELRTQLDVAILQHHVAPNDISHATDNSDGYMTPTGPISDPHIQPTKDPKKRRSSSPADRSTDLRDLRPAQIADTCLEFAAWSHHYGFNLATWPSIHGAAQALRSAIGVAVGTCLHAETVLGRNAASTAFALVFEKATLSRIRAPDAYLRELVRRGEGGCLNLRAGLHGVASHYLKSLPQTGQQAQGRLPLREKMWTASLSNLTQACAPG